ncbi:MAG: hypothetical protein ACLP7A_08145 [Desulfobaccales bacterium]
MSGRKTYGKWIVALGVLIVLGGGCNGVIYQKQADNGQTERVIIDKGEGWDSYNITPRYYSDKDDQGGYSIMVRDEHTF